MIKGLIHGHSGLAYLVLLTANISFLLSVVHLFVKNAAVLKVGTVLSRKVEPALMGLIGLLGLGVWGATGMPLTTVYLWIGVLVWIGHGMWAGMANKPTLVALAAGHKPKLPWVAVALVNAVLVNGVFGLMQAN